VAAELDEVERAIRPGARPGDGAGTLSRLRADLDAFREDHGLRDVVVVNVASTEPLPPASCVELAADDLARAAAAGSREVPASLLYAIAALQSGCAYVDFTPSPATRARGVDELARDRGLPYAGRDGKTGETLLKAALAPMFADRALAVRSWAATNLLGGGDGRTLARPETAASKLASKSGVISGVLGDDVEAPVRIDYLADLGEWKTAWDMISFEGFLGTRMRMQFIWDGCDSALAAPLVLDLARLAGLALQRGETGPLGQLGYFFKDPVGTSEHRLAQQFEVLRSWADSPGCQGVART
jgi:myo-inositol-1-phosphate synthase